jgi:hypothetical protein
MIQLVRSKHRNRVLLEWNGWFFYGWLLSTDVQTRPPHGFTEDLGGARKLQEMAPFAKPI